MTVGEAECARDYLDQRGAEGSRPRVGGPAVAMVGHARGVQGVGIWPNRFLGVGSDWGEGDLDRLAEACLEHCDTIDEWHTVTDARKVGERLRKG